MNNLSQKIGLVLFGLIIGLGLVAGAVNGATVIRPNQGGTGTSTAPTLGSLLVGVTSTQYGVLGIGTDGKCLVASSTAPRGVSWETCGGGLQASDNATIVGTWAFEAPVTASGSDLNITGGANIRFDTVADSIISFFGDTGGGLTSVGGLGMWMADWSFFVDGSGTGDRDFSIASSSGYSRFHQRADSAIFAALNTDSLTAARTYVFPDAAGTFALQGDNVSLFTNDAGYVTSSVVNGYLQAANNLSELTNTSTARTNLGLGDSATLASSTWLKPANNLSELTNTSTARTNLGVTNEVCTDPVFNIESPTSTEDLPLFYARTTSTLSRVFSVHKTAGDTVTFNVVWGANRTTATTSSQLAFSSATTSVSTTTGDIWTSGFASSSIGSGSWVRLITTAASSSNWSAGICVTQ